MGDQMDFQKFQHIINTTSDAYYPLLLPTLTSLPFYIVSIGIQREEGKINHPGLMYQEEDAQMVRPDAFSNYHILYSASGLGEAVVNGQKTLVPPGSFIFSTPENARSYEPIESPWCTKWISFNGYALEKLLPFKGGVYSLPDPEIFEQYFAAIFNAPKNQTWMQVSSSHLYRFLLELISTTFTPAPTDKTRKQVRAVQNYLNTHFHEELSLGDMASLAGISETHLCRLFQEVLQVRPFEYLTHLRIQKAKELLQKYPTLHTAEVAHMVGYKSPSYFTMLFKQAEGITPSGFRNMQP